MTRGIPACWLILLVAFSGCAAPTPQTENNSLPPEEALKKIQETIDVPETISAEYRIDGIPFSKDAKVLASSEGSIQIKRGNKVHLVMTVHVQGQQRTTEIISDGKRMIGISGDSGSVPLPTPQFFEAQVRTCLTWLTLVSLSMLGTPERDKDVRDFFKLTGVQSGDREGTQKSLIVAFAPGQPNGPFPAARIWYDPKTFLVSKRVLSTSKGAVEIVVTETFQKIVLGAPIGDEVFAVPE